MEQVSHDVRGITSVGKSRLSQGTLLRAEVQGAEGGQDYAGLLHQTVGLPCLVPLHRHKLQFGRKRAAHPLFEEAGDDVALQTGEAYHRSCEAELGDCGTFKGDAGQVGNKQNKVDFMISIKVKFRPSTTIG